MVKYEKWFENDESILMQWEYLEQLEKQYPERYEKSEEFNPK